MRKNRTSYTAQEKVIILRKHLLEKIPISDICEQYELRPTVFYRWNTLFHRKSISLCGQQPCRFCTCFGRMPTQQSRAPGLCFFEFGLWRKHHHALFGK